MHRQRMQLVLLDVELLMSFSAECVVVRAVAAALSSECAKATASDVSDNKLDYDVIYSRL